MTDGYLNFKNEALLVDSIGNKPNNADEKTNSNRNALKNAILVDAIAMNRLIETLDT